MAGHRLVLPAVGPAGRLLLAQLEHLEPITAARRDIWQRYHTLLEPLEAEGQLRRPRVPVDCEHNGHIYWLLLAPGIDRDSALASMREAGVSATFHYVPLHDAPAGRRLARSAGPLPVTVDAAARLVRLPLWVGLTTDDQARVVQALQEAIGRN